MKGFYNVVLCQIGKDTLCPPPFLSESLTQIKPAQSWWPKGGRGHGVVQGPVGVPRLALQEAALGWFQGKPMGLSLGRASGTGSETLLPGELGPGPLPTSWKGRCRASGGRGPWVEVIASL